MKRLLLIGLIICLSTKSAPAQCDQNTIKFKVARQRDWVKDFDKLTTKYGKGKVKISQLKPFFYIGNKRRECISKIDLQNLSTTVREVFKNEKNKDAQDFQKAIAGIAKSNPPGNQADVIEAPATVQPVQESSSGTEATNDLPIIPTVPTRDEGEQRVVGTNLSSLGAGENDSLGAGNSADLKTGSKTGTSKWFWVSLVLGLLSSILGGLAFWLNSQIGRQKKRFQKENADNVAALRKDMQTNFADVNKNSINPLSFHQKDKQRIEELIKTNDELMQEIKRLSQPAQPDTPNQIGTVSTVQLAQIAPLFQEQPAPKVFYLSTPTRTPDGFGTFLDQRKVQFDPTSSLYRFQLTANSDTSAQFWFESTKGTVSGALAYPETYLQPACEYTGLNSGASQISTDKPGRAVKQGDLWRVAEKARIKFV